MSDGTVISDVTGALGRIVLNRPKALNALTLSMVEQITQLLLKWQRDDRVGAVVIEGAGDRAFCAGGDIIALHDSGKVGDGHAERFWRAEYALCDLIRRYPKPYIALMDGYVMGGGAGVSMHGRFRVAGDKTLFAMPETSIGYFPDVGATYLLPRLRSQSGGADQGGSIGLWMGLTSARLNTAQTCGLDITNAYVPTDRQGALKHALANAPLDGSDAAVVSVMTKFVRRPEPMPAFSADMVAFKASSVAGILTLLDKGGDWGREQAGILRTKSPLALAVTRKAIMGGASLGFQSAMQQELNITLGFLSTQDFYEGIRAQVIDKDRNPKWSHPDIHSVTPLQLARLFRPASQPLSFL